MDSASVTKPTMALNALAYDFESNTKSSPSDCTKHRVLQEPADVCAMRNFEIAHWHLHKSAPHQIFALIQESFLIGSELIMKQVMPETDDWLSTTPSVSPALKTNVAPSDYWQELLRKE